MPKTTIETIGDIVIKMIDKGLLVKVEDADLELQNTKNTDLICKTINSISESMNEAGKITIGWEKGTDTNAD